jgi:hypothetical protein
MMNANVAKNYSRLTPEERFRLIQAATGRGDEAESKRVATAGGRITLSMQDHAPYAHAFDELALLIFIELSEEVGRYYDALVRADNACDMFGNDDEEDEVEEADAGAVSNRSEEQVGREPADGQPAHRLVQRWLDLVSAAGFMLRTKVDGWKLFCKRLSVPPFLLWVELPGFDRLSHAVKLSERAAFFPEGMARWLNTIRPEGGREATVENLISAEKIADQLQEIFRQLVGWWGG